MNAGITTGWKTKRITIDPNAETWEIHGQYYIGSVKFDASYSTTSEDLIPQLTNDAAVVDAVFEEIKAVLLSNMTAQVEAELQ